MRYRAMFTTGISESIRRKLKDAGFKNYSAYLKTKHWKRVKEAYKTCGLPQCCLACGHYRYELHHRSYSRLGYELLLDLIPLCAKCHGRVHTYARRNNKHVLGTHAILRKVFKWSKTETRRKFQPYVGPTTGSKGYRWVNDTRRADPMQQLKEKS